MSAAEVNFDGLVGPTHNYAGLSYGNVASMSHKARVSNPREAALQGLAKMKALADLGLGQGVLAPQARPDLEVLRALGFGGGDAAILRKVAQEAPALLAAVSSASSMWTANAATVSPSADTGDGRVHFTVANLTSKFHRAIEAETTSRVLKATFPGERYVHHAALPSTAAFGDEGAANHTRLAPDYGASGLEFFVYGRVAFDESAAGPARFPARQTREASETVARRHGLAPERVVLAQQNPEAIDLGAFHNDVVAVGNLDLLFCHERAFVKASQVFAELREKFARLSQGRELRILAVPETAVPLADAVSSYLFNSQLLRLNDGRTALISPVECRENENVAKYLSQVVAPGLDIDEVLHFDLRQSMNNGGGPACLRLRVVLSDAELGAVNKNTLMTPKLHAALSDWVKRHYRDRLSVADLADPNLVGEVRTALDELTQILGLGSVYPFQV